MKITKGKALIIKNSLTPSDFKEVALVSGHSENYVRKIMNGERSYMTLAGLKIVKLLIEKARLNKSFRKQSNHFQKQKVA